MTEIKCKECKDICIVEGDYPEFFAWCENCGTYAEGFDCLEYAGDYLADKIEEAEYYEEDLF